MAGYLNLFEFVRDGELFTGPLEDGRLQALLPTPCISNHAPHLIELENGDLLCAWFAGLSEGSADVCIVSARLKRGESRWEYMGRLSEDDTCSEQNPCFFQQADGTLYLFHTAQQSRGVMTVGEWYEKRARGEVSGHFSMQETAQIRCRRSCDNGLHFEKTQVFSDTPGSFCRHPILALSNGSWLFPLWRSLPTDDPDKQYGDDYSFVLLSSDQGKSWRSVQIPIAKGRVHMTVVETRPGHCAAFFRSRAADHIYRCFSDDYGNSWTPPEPTILPNNNASIQAALLPSGGIALIYNEYGCGGRGDAVEWPGMRWSISVSVSEDEGTSFPWKRTIEPGSGFTGEKNKNRNQSYEYPCMAAGRDGTIHIAYAAQNRRRIQYLRVTEEWLRG